jgi:hypothetical protein
MERVYFNFKFICDNCTSQWFAIVPSCIVSLLQYTSNMIDTLYCYNATKGCLNALEIIVSWLKSVSEYYLIC